MPLKRLAGPAALTGAAATKYTVGTGVRGIIRHIHISNTSAGVITVTVSIGTDAAGTRIFDAYSIAAGAVLDHYCLYVLAAAEIIQAFQNTGGTTGVLTIDGEEELV
jgi:hypothetical protein